MTYKLTKDLALVKTRNYKTWFKVSLLINFILIGYIAYLSNIGPAIKIVKMCSPFPINVESDVELKDSAILQELIKEGSVIPSVALAQAKIESGHYKSLVCRENKNLFGIKYHKCPFVKGQNHNHASYNTYKDNIKCYIHIQKHYLGNIDGHYAESPTYINKIKSFK
jgi:hypothetical protein